MVIRETGHCKAGEWGAWGAAVRRMAWSRLVDMLTICKELLEVREQRDLRWKEQQGQVPGCRENFMGSSGAALVSGERGLQERGLPGNGASE